MKYLNIFLAFVCVSCSEIQYSEFVSLPSGWRKDHSITFRYEATDSISKHNLYILLRNNDEYPFSNIFLITKMESPNNQVITDTLEYEMATPEGKWLGNGVLVKESKLWYKENVTFPTKGTYIFSVEQADRAIGKNEGIAKLKGITDVGLQIEAVKKNN